MRSKDSDCIEESETCWLVICCPNSSVIKILNVEERGCRRGAAAEGEGAVRLG